MRTWPGSTRSRSAGTAVAEVSRSRVGVATYLAPDGALDEEERVDALAGAIDSCVTSGELEVVVDLTAAATVGSRGLEVLLDAQAALARPGGELRIAGANASVREVLRITGADRQIGLIEPDGAEASAEPAPARPDARRRIGEILRDRGALSEETIEEALRLQKATGRRLVEIVLEKGWAPEGEVLAALAEQLGVPCVSLRAGLYDPVSARLIDAPVARRHQVVPLFHVHGVLYLATPDPQAVPTIDAIEDLTGHKVKPVIASTDQILATIAEAHSQHSNLAEYLGDFDSDLQLVEDLSEQGLDAIDQLAEGSPVINLINGIIQRAVRDRASDIHIERSRARCRVRLRVDGVLYTIMSPPIEIHPALISRLKVMANLDIAERRLPQDGRLQVATSGRVVDLRFSSLPGIFGEKVVLRLLDKTQAILDVDEIGLVEENSALFKELLDRSHGLLLVTGPTGSGKTTSLYAALSHLNSPGKNIVTIEDPVEYQIEGINQNQVRESIGLGFARILKHVLRQDPDIVMVGEIRERETAQIAVEAALTGHLVLSTLHTNDSVGAITRLLDMKIEPFLLSSALIGVMAQRLVRAVCDECATSYVAPAEALVDLGIDVSKKTRLRRGRGCADCYDSGYRGRLPIHEIVRVDQRLQQLIVSAPSQDDLTAYAQSNDLRRLFDDGSARVLAGETTPEEILRVVGRPA